MITVTSIERKIGPNVNASNEPVGGYNMRVVVKYSKGDGEREFTILTASHAVYSNSLGRTVNAIEATDDDIKAAVQNDRIIGVDAPSRKAALDRLAALQCA